MSTGKISSPSSLNYGKKNSGNYTFTANVVGTQIDANRIFVMLTFPFICENTNYTMTFTSCTLIGISAITPSTVTVDSKASSGARIAIPYSGTVGRSYAVSLTITFSF